MCYFPHRNLVGSRVEDCVLLDIMVLCGVAIMRRPLAIEVGRGSSWGLMSDSRHRCRRSTAVGSSS